MIPVLTAEEMRRADRRTIEEVGLPGAVLMENAGAAVASVVESRFADARRIVVLCGRGNNGGDGFVVARRLGARAEAVLLGGREELRGDAALHLGVLERSRRAVVEVPDEAAWAAFEPRLGDADLVIDAVLGTGLRSAPTGLAAAAITALTRCFARGTPVVAVDLPSGLPSDGGSCDWPVARASVTVTFAAPKRSHVMPPGCELVGELRIADIGISRETIAACQPALFLLEDADAAAAFPPRAAGAHKGDFGHVLVVAGSLGKTGAAGLTAAGVLRSGAGLVTVATPAPCLPIVAAMRPELMTEALPATGSGGLSESGLERLLSLARARDSVVIGPGLGQEDETRSLVRAFVRECPVPLVIDADGLNALAPGEGRPVALGGFPPGRPTILTPHPGEMARLVGHPTREVQRRRFEVSAALAAQTGAIVVLKGERTLIVEPQGRGAVAATGNPGMATGGTGDVLAGVLGALAARHGVFLAATAGVVVHGRAGDIAARERGEEGMIAGDLVDALPEAIASLGRTGGGRSER